MDINEKKKTFSSHVRRKLQKICSPMRNPGRSN
jgi:hypothetical protein